MVEEVREDADLVRSARSAAREDERDLLQELSAEGSGLADVPGACEGETMALGASVAGPAAGGGRCEAAVSPERAAASSKLAPSGTGSLRWLSSSSGSTPASIRI